MLFAEHDSGVVGSRIIAKTSDAYDDFPLIGERRSFAKASADFGAGAIESRLSSRTDVDPVVHVGANATRFILEDAIQRGVALALLVFMAPLMTLIAIAIRLHDGGPALFKHRRIGLYGAPFFCWKFRTMCVDSEARLADLLASDPEARREWDLNQKLRNDPRVTPLGKFLRKSSLDELPQVFNLLRGEMNLVGPRPIVEREIPRYGRRYRHYRAVRPGITGLWQISGRSDVDYRRRVALDSLYTMKKKPKTRSMDTCEHGAGRVGESRIVLEISVFGVVIV